MAPDCLLAMFDVFFQVNGLHIDPHLHIIRDADVISVRPPKFREENISISFFLPSPFLGKTPSQRFGLVYSCVI